MEKNISPAFKEQGRYFMLKINTKQQNKSASKFPILKTPIDR